MLFFAFQAYYIDAVNSKVYLSIDRTNSNEVMCSTTASYQTFGVIGGRHYTAFQFSGNLEEYVIIINCINL